MKLVTIKRATNGGITICCGELFEYAGLQFCITNSFDSNVYYAIEVSTGLSAHEVFTFDYDTEQACTNALKRWIRTHISLFNDGMFERSKKMLSENNYKFPLNKRI